MDIATRIRKWRELPPDTWVRAINRCLPQVVCGLLVILISYQIAQLTWTLLPNSEQEIHQPLIRAPSGLTATSQNRQEIQVDQIVDRHLFGLTTREYEESLQNELSYATEENILNAPDTGLSLQLKGVAADLFDSKHGAAIIADSQGLEKTYTTSDSIDGGVGAQLHSIYKDRVILNRSGNLESLRLPMQAVETNVSIRKNPEISISTQQASPIALSQNASNIREIIRVAPHIEQSQMIGFRITPGSERNQFDAMGFQMGDVITEINGTAMTDPTRGLQVFESLGESTQANVTIIRNGATEILTIDIGQFNQVL
ncbi:MAG: type II secretion system protein GspC [Rhodospirillaceae bacterium]|nr:type II secretion system protein GspC [Rhodospirillaceae bacterium]